MGGVGEKFAVPFRPGRDISLPVEMDPVEMVCKGCGGPVTIMGVSEPDTTLQVACKRCQTSEVISAHDIPNGLDYWAALTVGLTTDPVSDLDQQE